MVWMIIKYYKCGYRIFRAASQHTVFQGNKIKRDCFLILLISGLLPFVVPSKPAEFHQWKECFLWCTVLYKRHKRFLRHLKTSPYCTNIYKQRQFVVRDFSNVKISSIFWSDGTMPGNSSTIRWKGRKHSVSQWVPWNCSFYEALSAHADPLLQVRVHFDVMLKDTSSFNYAFW